MCQASLTDQQGDPLDANVCENFDSGILKQGLYVAVIKYWDYLRELNTNFLNSKRGIADIRNFLSQDELSYSSQLEELYFKSALTALVDKLQSDINNLYVIAYIINSFSVEFMKDEIIFIAYIIFVGFVYIFAWRYFLNSMTKELWKAKFLLGVVHPDILMNIPKMNQFILDNSGTDFLSKGHR